MCYMGLLAYLLCSAGLLTIREVPAGTRLEIRLTSTVGSYASKAGSPVSAVLIAPVHVGGELLLPAGSILTGTVKSVRRVGMGIVHETAACRSSSTRSSFRTTKLSRLRPG